MKPAKSKTRIKGGRPLKLAVQWTGDDWWGYRDLVEQGLDAIEARATSGLAWPKLDARKHAELITGWKLNIQAVEKCRESIKLGRPWTLAYILLGLHFAETDYLARRGEKSVLGAHAGGGKNSKARRNIMLVEELNSQRLQHPDQKASQLIRRIAKANDMTVGAVKAAIRRGRPLLKK